MKRTAVGILALLMLGSVPSSVHGQGTPGVEKKLPELIKGSESAPLKKYLASLQGKADAASTGELVNAVKVAEQINERKGSYQLNAAPLTYYAVPAISPVKRNPNVFPNDGELCGPLQIVAAKNEFEPASFQIFAFENAEKVELKASALSGKAGTIPATNVDLKIVKCWYQGGTAWYSYFADASGHEMVPELLLNDETLVKVDTKQRENYLRLDYPSGAQYIWISNPVSVQVPFNSETAPVADAKTLQPFQLTAGEFKQFWVTVKVPKDAKEGIYNGTIDIVSGSGKIAAVPLAVKVLPFELPTPMTYYDISREFYTMLYNDPGYKDILKKNGGDKTHADKKLLAIYENMRDHGIMNPLMNDFRGGDKETFIRQFEIMKQAGLSTNPIFGGVPGIPDYGWITSPAVKNAATVNDVPTPEPLIRKIDESSEIVKKLFGHTNVYCFGWDEPGRGIVLAERKPWKYIHEKGLMVYSTGHDSHLKFAGYNEDFCNSPGSPSRKSSDKWHSFGSRLTNYAGPHTGPENPDFMRRVHGLQLYKAKYDGIGNYILACEQWNDFLGEGYNFRAFNMTYPAKDGVIDTIEWEGIREAVDDVRYATLLKQLANKAIASGKVDNIYAGRKALLWLEMLDEKTADLNATRIEMINYIAKLSDLK